MLDHQNDFEPGTVPKNLGQSVINHCVEQIPRSSIISVHIDQLIWQSQVTSKSHCNRTRKTCLLPLAYRGQRGAPLHTATQAFLGGCLKPDSSTLCHDKPFNNSYMYKMYLDHTQPRPNSSPPSVGPHPPLKNNPLCLVKAACVFMNMGHYQWPHS